MARRARPGQVAAIEANAPTGTGNSLQTMRKGIIAGAALAAIGLGGHAQAQTGNTCQGRVVVDVIYTTALGGNSFEYLILLRNATDRRVSVTVTFSGFPRTVTLNSVVMGPLPIAAQTSLTGLRFGRGSWAQVDTGTVARVYDRPAGAGPTVRLTDCRQG